LVVSSGNGLDPGTDPGFCVSAGLPGCEGGA